MHPIRLMAMSLPHGADTSISINSSGVRGRKDADWAFTSFAMRGLSDYAMKYAFWRFCGDESQKRVIRIRLLAIARAKARDAGFKMKLETVIGVTNAAIEQATQPWCSRCNGVSKRKSDGTLVVCRRCKGTAQVQLTKEQIACKCNCNRRALKDNHITLYNFLLDVLLGWDRKVLNHIRDNLDKDLPESA